MSPRAARTPLALAALALASAALPAEPPPEPARPGFLAPRRPVFELPPVTIAPRADPRAPSAVEVRSIVFRGNTVVPTEDLEAIARPYVGRRVSAAEVEELRQKLTRLYVERGFMNSGALPAEAGDGVLAYEIVEGRLAAVRLRGLGRLRERYVVDRLARDTDGPFNVEVLRERFQLLLSDPLFTRLNARLMPGPRLAEAILDVDIERAPPWQLALYANNYRPPSIGSNAVGLRGWARNATGLGDVIEGSLEDSAEWNSGIRVSLRARVPVNAHGTSVSAHYDRGRSSVIEERLAILDIRSRLESAEAGVAQVLYESLQAKHSVGVDAVARENRTWLLGIPFSFVAGEPEGRIRTRTARLWHEHAWRSGTQALVARSTFSFVRTNVDAAERYRVWLGQAQYARRIGEAGAQLLLRATLQRASDKLLALDALPIGGVASVRGYRENELIRDRARLASVELEWPVYQDEDRALALTLAPFYDYGHGSGKQAPDATLTSAGVAARLRWGAFSASLAVARRLSHPAFVDGGGGNLQDHGVHFDVAWKFD